MKLRHDHGLQSMDPNRQGLGHIFTSSVHPSSLEEDLLASAARLRYSHQNRGCRDESRSFTTKLHHLVYKQEPSSLVKKILTLVKSSTRSGRVYELTPPERNDIRTARAEPFSDLIEDVFPSYRRPSFFERNFKGLSFSLDGNPFMERKKRMRIRKKLRVIPEDNPKATERKVRVRRSIFNPLSFLSLFK